MLIHSCYLECDKIDAYPQLSSRKPQNCPAYQNKKCFPLGNAYPQMIYIIKYIYVCLILKITVLARLP